MFGIPLRHSIVVYDWTGSDVDNTTTNWSFGPSPLRLPRYVVRYGDCLSNLRLQVTTVVTTRIGVRSIGDR
jgi:hypothetical protein